MTENELIELIEDALAEFAHSECPYCQANISLDKYVDRNDIEKWLMEGKTRETTHNLNSFIRANRQN